MFICGYFCIVSTAVKGKIVKKIETFPMIVIIISSILFVSSLVLNQNQTAMAQQQPHIIGLYLMI